MKQCHLDLPKEVTDNKKTLKVRPSTLEMMWTDSNICLILREILSIQKTNCLQPFLGQYVEKQRDGKQLFRMQDAQGVKHFVVQHS